MLAKLLLNNAKTHPKPNNLRMRAAPKSKGEANYTKKIL